MEPKCQIATLTLPMMPPLYLPLLLLLTPQEVATAGQESDMAKFLGTNYTVPSHLATTFTPGEVTIYRKEFAAFDKNGDGECLW